MRAVDAKGLLSKEHFSVDGTLIQAWASHKSFRPKDGSDDQTPSGPGRNAQADWKGKTRSNDTHESSTDPDARLFRKSHNAASVLCYQGINFTPACGGSLPADPARKPAVAGPHGGKWGGVTRPRTRAA